MYRSLLAGFIICFVVFDQDAYADDDPVSELESDFASAELKIVNKLSELPSDAYSKLCHRTKCRIVDFGRWWNSSDMFGNDEPLFQHLFTGVSNTVVAIVFQRGGIAGRSSQLMLMRRDSDWYCVYGIPWPEELVNNMKFLQGVFPPPAGSTMKCHVIDMAGQ